MDTPILIVFLLAIILLLSGCERSENIQKKLDSQFGWSMTVWKDKDTGCEYIVYSGYQQGGITARYDSEGKPICR